MPGRELLERAGALDETLSKRFVFTTDPEVSSDAGALATDGGLAVLQKPFEHNAARTAFGAALGVAGDN
jgi:hypothetical protein